MLETYRTSSIEWKPSPVIALATAADASQIAAARDDGSLEIWRVSPGSTTWHCLLTVHGDPKRRVSSLVWCHWKGKSPGRLFSSSIDGSVSEWDLINLKQKAVLNSNGVSIWQMAVAPHTKQGTQHTKNGYLKDNANDDDDFSDSEAESVVLNDDIDSITSNHHIAMACDNGCIQVYSIAASNKLTYYKSFPRVGGFDHNIICRSCVAWSPDAKYIYSGSSDGDALLLEAAMGMFRFIHGWDAKQGHEIYRITAGRGNLSSGSELCIWSLLALSSGTLVSGDSSGSVQFWDSQHGTLLQAHSLHKGDVNALAAAPTHNKVFSAGSDDQVILYKLSSNTVESTDTMSPFVVIKKWVYVGYVRAHTHDVRALAVAMPISREEAMPDENIKRVRRKKKPIDFSYHKWAHLRFPMLISAGDDTKLFAYSAKKFPQFSPHDICPAPQRVPTQLVLNTVFNKYALLLVQNSFLLDILRLRIENGSAPDIGSSLAPSVGLATTNLLARVKSKGSQKIICSTMSSSGELFAYSDNKKPSLFELKKSEVGKNAWAVNKQQLPKKLPFAHCMAFSPDASYLMIAGHDRRIYVVNLKKSEMVYTLTPCGDKKITCRESPITKLFISSDGQWLAAINCFGDMHIFNLEIQRQHWYISRLDGASVNAGGFSPHNNNMLVVSTSLNQVYVFDVETKQLGEWSMGYTYTLPRSYQELPGEVIGLSFSPSNSSSAIIYSARGMCFIDFRIPGDRDDNNDGIVLHTVSNKLQQCSILKRKLRDCEMHTKIDHRKNSDFHVFRDPVLFVGHLSENAMLVINKPWTEVVGTFDALPVHRHIYGT